MRKKKSVWQILYKIGVTFIYIAIIAVLIIQALTPGNESSDISDSVGDKIDEVVTDIQKPEVERVDVESVEILFLKVSGELLDTDEMSLYVGSSGSLQCEVTPDDATNPSLVYESSDSDIVTVYSDGRIKALKAGSAVITATSEENSALSDSVTVTVFEIAVENIEIANIPSTLHVEQTHALEIEYSPKNTTQKDITWKSSNESILTVNKSGKLTAKAEGTAVITATSKANGELVDSVSVTVLPKIVKPVIPVEGLTLTLNSEVGYIGSTEKITAKFSPTDAEDKLVWSSSDETVASVSQKGVVTYLKAGSVTIKATCSSYNVESSVTITVKEILSETIVIDTEGLDVSDNGGYTLKIATSGKLEASLDEEATVREIVFISSNPEIAKIGQDGVIEAISEGTVTITVSTSYDGETTSESFELTVVGYSFKDTFENFYYWVRKSFGHFGAFLALGIFAALTYHTLFPKSTKGKMLAFVVCLIAGFAVAGLTEIFQLPYFTTGRYCSFDDVILDFQGYCCSAIPIFTVILLVKIIPKLFSKIK